MQGTTCYIGVNLDTETVQIIGRYTDHMDGLTIIDAQHSDNDDGTIWLQPQSSFNGRRALAIALAETENGPIGLGWTFKVIPVSAENRNLSAAWQMDPLVRVRRAAAKAASARSERDDAIRAAVAAGCSVRKIADAAGLTHPRVVQITKAR